MSVPRTTAVTNWTTSLLKEREAFDMSHDMFRPKDLEGSLRQEEAEVTHEKAIITPIKIKEINTLKDACDHVNQCMEAIEPVLKDINETLINAGTKFPNDKDLKELMTKVKSKIIVDFPIERQKKEPVVDESEDEEEQHGNQNVVVEQEIVIDKDKRESVVEEKDEEKEDENCNQNVVEEDIVKHCERLSKAKIALRWMKKLH